MGAGAVGLPGVMLETQNINVAVCRPYASCGFVLGGFDACRYHGVMPGTREPALFGTRCSELPGSCGSREARTFSDP